MNTINIVLTSILIIWGFYSFLSKKQKDESSENTVDDTKKESAVAETDDLLPNVVGWSNEPAYQALIQFWLWQILLPLGGKRNFVGLDGFDSDRIAKVLKVFNWQYKGEYVSSDARKYLQKTYENWKKNNNIQEIIHYCPPLLERNIQKWAELLNLSDDECQVLKFCLLLNTDNVLDEGCDLLGELNQNQVMQILSLLLQIPESRIRTVLSTKSSLFNTGLVKIDLNSEYRLSSKLDMLSSRFVELMTTEDSTPMDMLKEHVLNAPQSNLSLEHFKHLGNLVLALEHYLKKVLDEKKQGCNILLYGMAGTGKTEFTRVMAKSLGIELFEVSWVDEDGDPADRDDRLSALRAAQHIFEHQRAILLFDEIEDVFAEEQKDFAINKAWVNRMMENNKVPTIWVTNQVYMLDPAMIRRFDFIIEMLPPTRAQRQEMLQEYTHNFLSKEDIDQLAEHQILVPALLERSHKITCAVEDIFPEKHNRAELFQKLLGNTLKAQGYADVTYLKKGIPSIYNVEWINSTQNLTTIANGLAKTKSATLCFYGPSGTGKSAYVKWVAEQIGRELIYKRASDLLSKYVGESEQLIAAAFTEARNNDAILLFDEVDSFLQDRRGASHGWEVSMVNEMLTQMEHFEGIFIATTNLMKNLDQAALRRFDFKIEFGYLKAGKAWRLFEEYCRSFGLVPDPYMQAHLNRIHVLTPGDFAVAAKRNRISPFENAEEFLKLLQEECVLKENGKHGQLGFM